MISHKQLTSVIREIIGEELLAKAELKDELANGVQFIGSDSIRKIALGVSLNEDFLQEAVRIKAQACIFHHGLDARTYKSLYSRSAQKRLRLIAKHDLNIFGFHYSLDAHPEIGNNSVIIRELGATLEKPLFDEWGFTAKFNSPQNVKDLSQKCAKLFEHDIFAAYSGPEKVTTIGVVSGGAKPYDAEIAEMEEKGVELFITGEPSESVPHRMKESGINYFAGGHYATEVFGVQELGKKLKEHFKNKLDVEFIDIPNPI